MMIFLSVDLFLQGFDSLEKLGKAANVSLDFHALPHGRGGFAGIDYTARETGGDSRAGSDGGLVTNCNVTGDADLGCDGDVVADFRTSCDSRLGNDETVLSDDAVVTDLDEIIELGAFSNDGFSETGAIDGGVGTDLYIIANLYDADLGDFMMLAIDKLIAIPVCPNDCSGVDNYTVSKHAALSDGDVRADAAVLSYSYISVNDSVGRNFRPISNA